MSRDFSPREHWLAEKQFEGLHFSNIIMHIGDKKEPLYSEEELCDRKEHRYLAVLGADIYRLLREKLSEEQFSKLNDTLGKLVEADMNKGDCSIFPKEMVCWYYNKNNHYYHEPNDEEFMEYIERCVVHKNKGIAWR